MYQESSNDQHEPLPIAANTTFDYEEHSRIIVEPQTPQSERNSLIDFE
jgi:hypothetical protein